ncbi:MAG: hypothetical protein IT539_08440 [Bradyrhizobiaceae bacterium]|nr:hypothetical protein [Bradyrhizobiaceae bacterium]
MKSTSKIVATVLATAIAASTISLPAFAHDPQNYKGPGILPLVAGPVATAALVGSSSTTLVKNFHFWKWQSWGWNKVHYLKSTGWDVSKDFKFHGKKVKVHAEKTTKSHSNMGKAVVGCIIGSAAGAITASIRKATALGNPPRWRSQAEHEAIVKSGYEKQFELTNDEAQTAVALCGLGSFALHWQQAAPVVKAKY